jgi:hypothetical protein
MRYGDTAKPDVNKSLAIGARPGNEIQKLLRGLPVKLWILQEPAKNMPMRISSTIIRYTTYYPEMAVASPQSRGLGTTAYMRR